MCGLFGFYRHAGLAGDGSVQAVAGRCLATIAHRGPDGEGMWLDAPAGIVLGHRRLAIIELSQLGAQPMHSHSGRSVIIYNGEIYNYLDLRAELKTLGHVFEGHSDTAVLLAGFEQWGVAETCRRANGMFAFVLWDRAQRRLILGRDHFGQKPLYFGWMGDVLLFGSELKPLVAHPSFRGEVDRAALTQFIRHGYVPQPRSIWRGIGKLPAGCILTFDVADLAAGTMPLPEPFWSARETARRGLEKPFEGSRRDAADRLEALLSDAVRRCMISDVALGVFLSGGVDSSLITALMQSHSSKPVRSFSIGFADRSYDEAVHAAAVARHLGTDHTQLRVTEQDALDLIPTLPRMYDEPFADSSQMPTHLVSRLARDHVTVSLSGDGGDELFAGYNRYLWGRTLARAIDTVPGRLRSLGCTAIQAVSPAIWDRLALAAGAVVPRLDIRLAGDKLHKLAGIAAAGRFPDAYLGLTSLWSDPQLLTGAQEPASAVLAAADSLGGGDVVARMMLADTLTYLPDDILTKVDRASMAASLESRAPFLDPRLFEFAWQLPQALKLQAGTGKTILRDVLYRHVPPDLIERPKMGFAVPIADWLRGPLRGWAESLLAADRLGRDGFLDAALVRRIWQEHLSGRRNWQHRLWAVLMFQAWFEVWS